MTGGQLNAVLAGLGEDDSLEYTRKLDEFTWATEVDVDP